MSQPEHDPRELQVSVSPESGARPHRAASGRLRGLIEVGVVLLAAASVFTIPHPAGDRGTPAEVPTRALPPGSAAAGGIRPGGAFRPRLIAPDAASAGEQIPVLAFHYRGTCGPIELTFDDTAVAHRLTRYAGSSGPGWIEVFMTVTVPSGATRGHHEIQLYGPTAPCRKRPHSADASTRRELLATSTVTLGP